MKVSAGGGAARVLFQADDAGAFDSVGVRRISVAGGVDVDSGTVGLELALLAQALK